MIDKKQAITILFLVLMGLLLIADLYGNGFVFVCRQNVFTIKDNIIDIRIADVDSNNRNEIVLLTGEQTSNSSATVLIYKVKNKSLNILSKASVKLNSHTGVAPPKITFRRFDRSHKKQLLVSNGPLLEFNKTLYVKYTRDNLMYMLFKKIKNKYHSNQLSSDSRSAAYMISDNEFALLVWQEGSNNGPLLIKTMNSEKALTEIPLYLYKPIFSENWDKHNVIAGIINSTQKLYTYGLRKPFAKTEVYPTIYPYSISDIDNNGQEEIIGRQWRPSFWPFRLKGSWVFAKFEQNLNLKRIRGLDIFQDALIAVGDIDNDGQNELLVVYEKTPNQINVYTIK